MVRKKKSIFGNIKLAELHTHVGGSVDPAIMWGIAHNQGIKLPTKDFWEFVDLITVSKDKTRWKDYHQLFHWTELIQSSPEAIERSVYEIIGGAYINCNISLLEVGFNPMFRNRGGERDLDHIIMAAVHGMEKALLEYPVKAGLIFMLDKRLSFQKNKIIVEKAIKYRHKGVVGIDFAGLNPNGFSYSPYKELYTYAGKMGLGLAVHAGEEGTAEEMKEVIDKLSPNRIIHGVKAVDDNKLIEEIKKRNIVLAVCPTSNLKTGVIKEVAELGRIIRKFLSKGIKFCLNTDAPEMLKTNLLKEFELLLTNKIMSKKELLQVNRTAFESSFIQ